MPSNRMAWSHLLGGSAFVKMSADCMSVWTYSIEMRSLSSCSAMQARFTLWVRWTQRSLDEKPFLATRIVAWLSSWILGWNGRSKISSHKLSAGRASWYREYARDTISASVVDRETEVCLLDTHARGKCVCGPLKIKNPQDVDFASRSPAKSAST